MEWSGRAPAPPASEAGKGRQRRGARHVTQAQFWDRNLATSDCPNMFTIIAAVAVIAISLWTDRLMDHETVQRAVVFDDDIVQKSVVFGRRDLRLIAWMLAAMLIMLGIIADRIH